MEKSYTKTIVKVQNISSSKNYNIWLGSRYCLSYGNPLVWLKWGKKIKSTSHFGRQFASVLLKVNSNTIIFTAYTSCYFVWIYICVGIKKQFLFIFLQSRIEKAIKTMFLLISQFLLNRTWKVLFER